ncbi:MAG: patatin-like phospholipase family protein [Pseudomonadota bacterium]
MPKRINLALQGGGAHGAFTWGVLDRLLEDEDLEISAISGTSAGALNGAALKSGLVQGGREAARETLDRFWQRIGALEDDHVLKWMENLLPPPAVVSHALELSLPFATAEAVGRLTSPYVFGPLVQNPLASIVREFSYDDVCAEAEPALFVCATNVRTGKIRVFDNKDINEDALLASACLPTMFQAVEVKARKSDDIEAYWDGGYTGNPALYPLFHRQFPDDIVIVNINPLERPKLPVTPQEIQNRINEISFNSSLFRELRAISFVKRLIADGSIKKGAMKDVNVHMIADDTLMTDLSVATKMTPIPYILSSLKDAGRAAATGFLQLHEHQINVECSVDLEAMFS